MRVCPDPFVEDCRSLARDALRSRIARLVLGHWPDRVARLVATIDAKNSELEILLAERYPFKLKDQPPQIRSNR